MGKRGVQPQFSSAVSVRYALKPVNGRNRATTQEGYQSGVSSRRLPRMPFLFALIALWETKGPQSFLAVTVLIQINTEHDIICRVRPHRDYISTADRPVLPKPPEWRKKLRAKSLVNDDTGLPITETTPGLCLKNADQYTYNQTELHKPNIVDGVFVPRASLFCMVGNAYVASLFDDLLIDHSAFCSNLT